MSEWINSIITSDQTGIVVFAAVFLLGVISTFTCACNFAVLGVLGGYTGAMSATGRTKTVVVSSVFFLLGIVIALSVFGCLIGFAGELVSVSMGNYWKIAAGVIAILFGIYTLDILPFKIKSISPNFQSKKGGVVGAIIFGFVMGGATSLGCLCCNPIFPVVVGASFLKGSTLWGVAMLFFYALGHGLTIAVAMLGVGLGLGKMSKLLSKFAVVIKYAGGITLIVFGFYLLLTI